MMEMIIADPDMICPVKRSLNYRIDQIQLTRAIKEEEEEDKKLEFDEWKVHWILAPMSETISIPVSLFSLLFFCFIKL